MPTFDDYKQRVSIIQIAEDLGYKYDKTAGKIKPVFKLNDKDGKKIDEIVIVNPNNSANQYYFDRNYNKGDLISFIKKNLDQFPQFSHSNDFVKINMILSHYSNIPYVADYSQNQYKGNKEIQTFDPDRYIERKPEIKDLTYLTRQRGISPQTVEKFLPFITTVKDSQSSGNFYNIAFPYTKPGYNEITNYELRNYGKERGFKGMATGGDKSNSLWLADFTPKPEMAKNLYVFESAIDAMSFYQLNKDKISLQESVFASVGGYISNNQITNTTYHYPNARMNTGFDNDLNGHIYDIKVASLLKGKEVNIKISQDKQNVDFKIDGKEFSIRKEDLSLEKFKQLSGLRPDMKVHKADKGFNDFNEILQSKPDISYSRKL